MNIHHKDIATGGKDPHITYLESLNVSHPFLKKLHSVFAESIEESKLCSPEQLSMFWKQVAKAADYMVDKYGPSCIPAKGFITAQHFLIGPQEFRNHDLYAYDPKEKKIGLTYNAINTLAFSYQQEYTARPGVFTNDHLLTLGDGGIFLSPQDFTVVQLVEEYYHAYQFTSRNLDPISTDQDRTHPLELEINNVVIQAIIDLKLTPYSLKTRSRISLDQL